MAEGTGFEPAALLWPAPIYEDVNHANLKSCLQYSKLPGENSRTAGQSAAKPNQHNFITLFQFSVTV